MAGICTVSVSPNNCSHRTLTFQWDGVEYIFPMEDVDVPLTAQEKVEYLKLSARYWRSRGVTLPNFVNRCIVGEEATNVKQYQFFGPGAAITKTNIGTSYVNINPGLNGERIVADFTGCTEFRLILHANLVGTGQWGARVIKDSNSDVLIEAANLGAAGERELDSDWTTLPAAFQGQGLMYLRVQAKSTTAADDPVFRSCVVGLR